VLFIVKVKTLNSLKVKFSFYYIIIAVLILVINLNYFYYLYIIGIFFFNSVSILKVILFLTFFFKILKTKVISKILYII
jgi:hypothetical protein